MASGLRPCQYVERLKRHPGSGQKGRTAMTYVNNFGDVGDVAAAGGKGVGLGGLVKAGLPVPPGFVLNTAAYTDFVAANHLEAGIQDLAALSPQATPQAYDDAAHRIG